MSEPISRRDAIFRAFATVTAGGLFSFESFRNFGQPAKRKLILPGESFGAIELAMADKHIAKILGDPESQPSYPGGNQEQRRREVALSTLFKGTAGLSDEDIERLKSRPLANPCTYFTYESKGISIRFEYGKATSIFGYTGIPCGHDKGSYKSCFPLSEISDIHCPVETLDDVIRTYGPPDAESPNEYAPIPDTTYRYNQGVSFCGRLDDRRISSVIISAPKE